MKKISTLILCLVAYLGAIFNAQAQVTTTAPVAGVEYGIVFDGGTSYTANGYAMYGDASVGVGNSCQYLKLKEVLGDGFAADQLFTFEYTGSEYNGKSTFYLKASDGTYVKYWGTNTNDWCVNHDETASLAFYIDDLSDNGRVNIRAVGETTNGTLGLQGGSTTNLWVSGDCSNNADGRAYWKITATAAPSEALVALIATATELAGTLGDATGVQTYLTDTIVAVQAVVDNTGSTEDDFSAALTALNTSITLVNSFNTAIAAANAILASTGTIPVSQGWTPEADATLTAAIVTANAVGSDAALITAAITELNTAVNTYKAAELVPRVNADETIKYRILITDNAGNYVRYMAKDDTSSTQAVPKVKDVAINPDLQLFYLHPVAGVIDGYRIENASSGQYLSGNGSNITSDSTNAPVWVAVYNKSLTTEATTAAGADGAWFRLNQDGNAGKFWCTDNGTWPDAISNMWVGKSGDTRGTLFRIEEDVDPSVAFDAFKAEFLAYIAEVQTLYNTTVSGTLPGQYTGKAELADAITVANTAYSESTLLSELVAAKLALEAAVTTYQSTQISPYVGYTFRLKHYSSDNYLSRSTSDDYTNARIQPLGTENSDQIFEFESVPGIANGVRLKTIGTAEDSSVYVVIHSGYTSSWTTTPDAAGADMVIVEGADYILLGFTNGANSIATRNYFGAQSTSAGSSVYTDNNGQNEVHRWVMEIIDPKVNLNLAIADATTKLELAVVGTGVGQYPQTAVDSLTNAVALATGVYDNEEAETADIDVAILDLQTTLSWFVNIPVARDALYALIASATTTKQAAVVGTEIGQYPQSTIATFTDDIAAAQAVAVAATSTDIAINAATADLQISLTWFISVPVARDALHVLIDSANTKLDAAVVGTEIGQYQQSTIDTFTDDIAEAQAVADNAGATDADINAATADLQTAITWFINVPLARAELSTLIATANTNLEAAIPGTAVGQHPQAVIDALTEAVGAAQDVFDNVAAPNETVSAALVSLQTAFDLFISQEISYATQYYEQDWNIVHATGNLLSKVNYTNALGEPITSAVINVLNTANTLQEFTIVPVPGFVNTVAIKSSDNKYLGFSGWDTYWGENIDASARVVIDSIADGFVRLRFADREGNNYLGVNDNALVDSATVYADKNGNNFAHRWQIRTPGAVLKVQLQVAIGDATALLGVSTAGTELYNFPQTAYNTFSQAITSANTVFANADVTQVEVDAATETLRAAIALYYTQQILPLFAPDANTQYIITNKAYSGYFKHNGKTAVVEAIPPVSGWEFVNVRDSVWVLKSDTMALAKSLNMVDFDATQVDQQWYVHYDGKKENNIYVEDTTDTKNYFSFSANSAFNNTIQQSSTTLLEIVADYNPTSQNQWFTIAELGAPISTALAEKIAEVTATLSSTTVDTTYGNYPQAAKDSLTTARDSAQAILDNVATLTQQEINDATESLSASLIWYLNQKIVWKPAANTAYYIGNHQYNLYLTIDTIDTSNPQGYALDAVPFVNQLWFFVPIENKAGFYYIVNNNQALNGGRNSASIAAFNVGSSQWEFQYKATDNETEYFRLVTSIPNDVDPGIWMNSDGDVSAAWNSGRNYEYKLVAASVLRTEVLLATNLLDSVIVGNQFGQTPQTAYDEFLAVINASIVNAKDGDETNDTIQFEGLQAAEILFRDAENGKGLDLEVLTAAIDTAQGFIDQTTVIGEAAGECPQSVIDTLTTAVLTAKDATGVSSQTDVDAKVTAVNTAVDSFKIALKASTGLADLIGTAQDLLAAAVEGSAPEEYVVGSKATFEAAINVAIADLATEPVSQAALLDAVNTLTVALDNFNAAQNPSVYTEDLAAVIADVELFLSDKLDDEYTALRALLVEAQALLADPSATQAAIDEITDELYVALENAGTAGIDDIYGSQIAVYSANGMLRIEGLQGASSIKVYNALGQIVLSSTATGNDFEQSLKRGYYIVRINTISKKLLVK